MTRQAEEKLRDLSGGGGFDDIIVLRDVTWADYQRLLEIRGERPVPRLTYLEGALELMTPSRPHESLKSMIGCLAAYVWKRRWAVFVSSRKLSCMKLITGFTEDQKKQEVRRLFFF